MRGKVTDPLDAVGNTTKAVTKGYAIGSAGLAALVLFASYRDELNLQLPAEGKDVAHARSTSATRRCVVGLLIGGADAVPVRVAGDGRPSAARAARWSRRCAASSARCPGSWTAPSRPDYARCVDIVTRSALREMLRARR